MTNGETSCKLNLHNPEKNGYMMDEGTGAIAL